MQRAMRFPSVEYLAFRDENSMIECAETRRGRGRAGITGVAPIASWEWEDTDGMPEADGKSFGGDVRVAHDAGVAVVTIDRPEVRNAIGFTTIDALADAL